MRTVASLATEAEVQPRLPDGSEERFAGYGIMGQPFRSGHVLAMRRFPASTIGPAYTSIWHRDPTGRWAFWQDQPAELACPRYFSAALTETRAVEIELDWRAPSTLRLSVPELGFEWSATLRSSPVTNALNALGAALPERAWRSGALLSVLGPVAGTLLRAGRLRLAGRAPNGQYFIANPLRVWLVAETTASLAGADFGPTGPLERQAALGDFRIPQRGIFAIGRALFRAG